MSRLGAVAAGTAGAWLALGAGVAPAAQAVNVDAASVAAVMARIIQRDAREELRVSRSAVTVAKRCCGVRVLRVHYGVKRRPRSSQSSYVLRLELRGGELQGVAIFETSSEAHYAAGARAGESSSLFAFVIHHERRSWSTVVTYEVISRGREGLGGQPGGLGFARACALRSTLPRALYSEVLSTLERARRHRAFEPDGVAPSLCLTD